MFCAVTNADRRRGARYLGLMVASVALTFSLTVIRHRYLPRTETGIAHDFIALLPLVGIAGILGAVADFIRHADEYMQRRLLTITAAACALTLFCTMAYALLESAGWPHQSMSAVWFVTAVAFLVCTIGDLWLRKR